MSTLQTPTTPRFSFPQTKTPSRLAFGAAKLGAFWQRGDREQRRAFEEALRLGLNLIDTADVYARGLSERLIGQILGSKRNEVILCTKAGQIKTPWAALSAARSEPKQAARHLRAAVPGRTPKDPSLVPRCFDSRYLIGALEGSLRRLRTDHVEIFLLHSPNAQDIAHGAWRNAAQSLLAAGKILHFGISCDDQAAAQEALAHETVAFLELPVNALSPQFDDVIRTAGERGVGVLARSPFDGGRVSRLARSLPSENPEDVLAVLLRSVTDRPEIISTIVGMRTTEQLERNLALQARPLDEATRLRLLNTVQKLAESKLS
jgi:aryl-alcohol dehydrogenase-like predicted oxidoreductase